MMPPRGSGGGGKAVGPGWPAAVAIAAEKGHHLIGTMPLRMLSAEQNSRFRGLGMKPSEALRTHREMVRRAVASHRACNARVFGSVIHGDDRDGSDLDLLVDTLPGATLFDLGGLQIELEETLGISIDVLTPGDLPAKYRDQVLAEAVPI